MEDLFSVEMLARKSNCYNLL